MFVSFFVPLLALASTVFGITVTTSTASYTIDSESIDEFVVAISRTTCDITSILYRDTKYQYGDMYSHIVSSLGSSTTVSYKTVGDHVVVSCVADDDEFDLTNYLIFEDGSSLICMGTYTITEPEISELRFIHRLTNLPNGYKEGNVSDIVGENAIEAKDVYLVDTESRSKFYSSQEAIDDDVYCGYATDSSVNACYVIPTAGSEKNSGGPFHRDIDLNGVLKYQSITYYMNSAHTQTEAYRMGFYGPYVMSFSRTGIPKSSDFNTTFFNDLSLTGYVGPSGREIVRGTATGTSCSYPTIIHWYNDDYQDWANAPSSGSFTSPPLVAGTYTMAMYQQEFLAATTPLFLSKPGRPLRKALLLPRKRLPKLTPSFSKLVSTTASPSSFSTATSSCACTHLMPACLRGLMVLTKLGLLKPKLIFQWHFSWR